MFTFEKNNQKSGDENRCHAERRINTDVAELRFFSRFLYAMM